MDSPANQSSRRMPSSGTPALECQDCSFPMLLVMVERRGQHRSIDCPYCGRHDEWVVLDRS